MAATAPRLLLMALMAATLAGRSEGAWCICRQDMPDSTLQKTLDYACGDGADCKPIQQSGACFSPDTVKAHCSYAVNSFYQRNNQNSQACVFSGTATLVTTDPSSNGCMYPASASAAGTGTPTSGTGGSTGVDGPPGMGLGPSSFNDNSGASLLPEVGTAMWILILACSIMVLNFS
ncbi:PLASMODESMATA CALLOSE-BINDING PROTEIN 2 [Oryza sativa Japonica Group]|uniref:Expressed protein n=5 Tax=Oryza TaxID=4527 RepID=A0A0P0W3V1_ORYSJ|nr:PLASMODESMATA CALLOSE-BINDING PROTEIN 2 [Oryza sativa Japonica Group]EAY91908.1 hypothetical protein OsI_13593 [Oryza sativa Indica Group]KAB8093638.1 hypothetical protein EE612_020526 [Oryza sativa]AAR01676.1 expressed protein [Oryza sativa Japonica Group]ABF98954.1 expressed protein [Oryza sativa Japonica Group]EAZ28631.1 hypothetical protein OsJ_12641 [Oryza sativa Japonica Group]|eukprot:NP_001051316.1 Os03g0756300 [Oryza sativa Japonica Group]